MPSEILVVKLIKIRRPYQINYVIKAFTQIPTTSYPTEKNANYIRLSTVSSYWKDGLCERKAVWWLVSNIQIIMAS